MAGSEKPEDLDKQVELLLQEFKRLCQEVKEEIRKSGSRYSESPYKGLHMACGILNTFLKTRKRDDPEQTDDQLVSIFEPIGITEGTSRKLTRTMRAVYRKTGMIPEPPPSTAH